jgi:hypothetical protein
MPTHTIPGTMIKFFLIDEAPWNWVPWKDITNVRHGPFPSDDNLLPEGLSRKDVEEIQSYFSQYDAIPGEEAKVKFMSQRKGTHIPGRDKWRDWVTTGWKSWKIHSRITDVLIQEQLHPLSIILLDQEENPLKYKGKLEFPMAETYIPVSLDAVALNLFGEESLDSSSRLTGKYRHVTQLLVQRTWMNICKQLTRNQNRLGHLEDAATRDFDGKGLFLLVVFEFHWRLRHEMFLSVCRTPCFLLLAFTLWTTRIPWLVQIPFCNLSSL